MTLIIYRKTGELIEKEEIENLKGVAYEYQAQNGNSFWVVVYPNNKDGYAIEINPENEWFLVI